ncbi:membrane associated rhomboid family serine protease [Rhizomicrobium palustre]|uniref:Membrane associated rhomboid family serine protease n=1 Tax=Rhizomicrobium palustre TaxID=189966 RepID=A0A846MYM8_9PROT|nr:rhomboid family intramembrane serine protease [Rhizomicrobium palustre]NIK88536.1 membrane associated rhomboid family serine protease [Rhizomicrobium palustre]
MAFLQAAPPREPFLQAPASVLWLIGVLIAAHLAFLYGPWPESFWDSLVFVPERLANGVTAEGLWPLVTHMFLHGGTLHLTFNCLWLLVFGAPVARRYGTGLFLLLFFACGIAGALTHLALHWGSSIAILGASGGVSGLMGAAFRLIHWPGTPQGVRLVPLFSRPLLTVSALWLLTNLIFGLTGFEGQAIAWEAHMGGFFLGLLGIGVIDRLSRRDAYYSAG